MADKKTGKNVINKKGILASETLKIVIAVLCLVLLVYLGYSFYGLLVKKTSLEQAKESIKILSFEIEKAQKGEMKKEFLIESPNKWWIIAWPYKSDNKKPVQCKKNFCACICPLPSSISVKNSLKECNTGGVCSDYDIPVKTIYLAEPPSWYAKLLRNVQYYFGVDVKNVPIDIGGPLPLRVKIENNEILIIKERNKV